MASATPNPSNPRALVFDLMGTCCDWYSSILPALQSAPAIPALPAEALSQFAVEWRAGFFKEVEIRREAGQSLEDIDVTHRRVLSYLLHARGVTPAQWNDSVRNELVQAWHRQKCWPDVEDALERLKRDYFVVVLANGSTRLQLDIIKSSGLAFHTLFSSQLLGKTKPDAGAYQKILELMQIPPANAIMVAAHAYDLSGAKKAGMRTVYIKRSTEDLTEDMNLVRKDVDFFLDGTTGSKDCGLGELATILGL